MAGKDNILVSLASLSILAPAYILGTVIGFLPITLRRREGNLQSPDYTFHSSSVLTIFSIVLKLVCIALLYDLLFEIVAFKNLLYLAMYICNACTLVYLFSLGFHQRDNIVEILNTSYRLIREFDTSLFSINDILPFPAIIFYIIKPFMMPVNFKQAPTLHLLLLFTSLNLVSFELLVLSSARVAQEVLEGVNRKLYRVSTHPTRSTATVITKAITKRWQAALLIRQCSMTLGARYLPVFLLNVVFCVLGVLTTIKPFMNEGRHSSDSTFDAIVFMVQWSSPFYTFFLICRISFQSRDTKRCLQHFLMKDEFDIVTKRLVIQFLRLIDDSDLYLRAGESLLFDSSIFFAVLNIVVMNSIAFLPLTNELD